MDNNPQTPHGIIFDEYPQGLPAGLVAAQPLLFVGAWLHGKSFAGQSGNQWSPPKALEPND
jgi:hypothetical protein